MEKKQLTGKEKFAYGIGAVGKDMVYMLSATYVLYYYQDIMGVNPIAMGVILLAARIFDAFNDPIMGILVAKTKTRWGKFRPWLFIGTVLNAFVLYFLYAAPPSLEGNGLVVYAAVTYILWGVTYTMMDIPFWSMIPAFTESGKERENLTTLGRSCAGVGSALITVITVVVVAFLGNMAVKNGSGDDVLRNLPDTNVVLTINEITDLADGEATGNAMTITSDDAQMDITLTGYNKEFTGALSYDESTASYTITLGDEVLTESNSKMTFSMASKDADEITVTLEVPAEEYEKITTTSTVNLNLISTREIERNGFQIFALIVSILFIVFILITCVVNKEKSTVDTKAPTVGEMFKALLNNDQAIIIVISIVLINCSLYLTSNLLIYYFKYDVAGTNWKSNYTLFNAFGGAMQILSMMIVFPLLRKAFNSIRIFFLSCAMAIGGYFVLFILMCLKINNIIALFIPGLFIFLAFGMLTVLTTIFLANSVDYGEWKNKRRDESVIFSMQTFVVKLASGIAVMAASVCLSVFHISDDTSETVVANVAGANLVGLRVCMSLIPIVGLAIATVVFAKKYILTDEKLDEITEEIKKAN